MIGKLAVALAAPLLMSASHVVPARTEAGIDPQTRPEIVRVDCLDRRGTAFYVGPDTLLSVMHVAGGGACFAGGQPFEIIAQKGDFAVLKVQAPVDRWLRIDCGGFVTGKTYEGVGHARGLPTLTVVDVVATGQEIADFYRLWGVFHVVPGQSGGAFIDPHSRKVVGVINVYDPTRGDSGATELKGTSLCA